MPVREIDNILLSIIIPFYNVYEYIEECLHSISKQTKGKKFLEVILIDDGSLDNSITVVTEYLYNNKNFRLIKKKNGGLSSARNYGLNVAKGDYLLFIDSDDFIDETLINRVCQILNQRKPDIILYDFYNYFTCKNKKHISALKGYAGSIQKDAFISPPAVWNKVFKKSLFVQNNISFPEGFWYEDLGTVLRIYLCQELDIVYIQKPLYYYRQRPRSIMAMGNEKNLDIIEILNLITNFKSENSTYHNEMEYVCICNLFYAYTRIGKSKLSKKRQLQIKLVNYLNELYPRWWENLYFKREKWYTKMHIVLAMNNICKFER